MKVSELCGYIIMEFNIGAVCVALSAIIQVLFGAQPRPSSFINYDVVKGEALGQYAKLLQPPLAFSYTQDDSKTSESVIKQRRLKPEPPPVLRKLDSKRMLRPKKHFQKIENQEDDSLEITHFQNLVNTDRKFQEKKPEFLIYVPEESISEESEQSPIIISDSSVEQIPKEHKSVAQSSEIEVAESDKRSEIKKPQQSDQNVQETHHKKHKPKPVNTKFEKGAEKSEKSSHHETSKKKGDKGYHGEHVKHKVEKSHHVKKGKSGHYEDKGGDEKKFDKEEDYKAGQHEEDGGQKGSKYEEDGENDKGHATKGTHNVRKKDEYVKKVEFFDEYHEDSDEDEGGGHEAEKDYKNGHHDHKGHHDSAYKHDDYGDHKSHEDSHEEKYSKSKHDTGAHDTHHDHDKKHDKKKNHESKKIWKIIVADKNR